MRKIKQNGADRKLTKTLLRLRVNGETKEVATEINKTLLEVLREDMGLTGTKHGCELGECGTCAVLVDGKSVLSCLMLGIEAENTEIITVEGMMQNGKPHPLAEKLRGSRRGAMWLLHSRDFTHGQGSFGHQSPSDPRRDPSSVVGESVSLHGIHENLASRRARRERRGIVKKKTLSVIGKPLRKIDAMAKCAGETIYADDLNLPRTIYAKLLRSPSSSRSCNRHQCCAGP